MKSMNKHKNIKKIILSIIVIINISITFVCLINIYNLNLNFRMIIFLPILYSILFAILKKRIILSTPGMFTIITIAFFRYLITPLVIILTNQVNAITRGCEYFNEAIFIMIIEMISIFIIILFYIPKNKMQNIRIIRFERIIEKLVIISILILFINIKFFISRLLILVGINHNINSYQVITSGQVVIIWQAIATFIFCFLIEKNYKHKKSLILSLVYCLIYLLTIYVTQMSISRWYTIVSLISIVYYLLKLYPKDLKKIYLYIIFPISLILLIATISKNTKVTINENIIIILKSIFTPTNMDTYFAGPININTAMYVKKIENIGIKSLFYDIFNNFPYLNKFISKEQTTVRVYNLFLKRGDQIIPLVGQSFIWFSYLFTPLLTIVSTILVKKNDRLFEKSKGIKTYLYAFLAVWCALMPILNVTIWLSWLYSRIIPAFLLFKILTKKSYKQKEFK